ncbi:hypothetical protein [Phenylobacterium sp.]|uniref:hypothetical protein n=1 Tax=Phenylobacterium sp. TaxID=1871053 RepID=UPI002F417EAC
MRFCRSANTAADAVSTVELLEVELVEALLALEVLDVEPEAEVDSLDVEAVSEPFAVWRALSRVSKSLLSGDIGPGAGGRAVVAVLLVELADEAEVALELDEVDAA